MYKRLLKIDKDSKQSFFLFGPRGTGKTTWIKANFKDCIYLDLLKSDLFRTLSANPEKLENFVPDDYVGWIVLDEVQKIPTLLNEVHRLIQSKGFKFILTGSSARNLRKKGINLLAGRALTKHFYPLTAKELGKDFSLEHSLKFGNLPMAYGSKEPELFLDSYIQTYLKEEVMQEGLTRNIGDFARFLEIASFSQGEVLNMTQVARDAQVERKTVESYFNILEDLLLAERIGVFAKRAKRKLISHNKFYYFDVGVFRSLRPRGPLDSEAEVDGPALETLFLQEIKALNEFLNLGYKIFYWRTIGGIEVDFILYGPKGLIAIEIKRKKIISKKDLKGLKAFAKDYPEAKTFIFCSADTREYHDNIVVMPILEALKNLDKILENG